MTQVLQLFTSERWVDMAFIAFKFSQRKATEAILYLANRLPVPNVYRICKMLYLADKSSLNKYGRFIFGETYVAMKGGGTPSNVYDLLKQLRITPSDALAVKDNTVIVSRYADLDYLSSSDIECLDQVITRYAKDWTGMKDAAHDNAWEKAWATKGTKKSSHISIESIARMFRDSNDLVDYLSNSG
jgi:hypothetical protein